VSYIQDYCQEASHVIAALEHSQIEKIISILLDVRKNGGRLFFLGVGGSAANCSHAVNDFRKIGGFEAYTPVDNVAELTARTNDEGWNSVFEGWLKGSRLNDRDAVFIFSVGGGSKEKNISANLVYGLDFAKSVGAKILGVVGRDGVAAVPRTCGRRPGDGSRRATDPRPADPVERGGERHVENGDPPPGLVDARRHGRPGVAHDRHARRP
jgi:D-sedoheptulose 7-phosphate isomerase